MAKTYKTSPEVAAASKAAPMNQVPENILGQSPLHHVDFASMANLADESAGIVLCERALLGHLTLRLDAGNSRQLKAAEKVLGVKLPVKPLTSAQQGDVQVRWISPNEWLISVPGDKAFDYENSFRDTMVGHYAVVNGSGGMTLIQLSGNDVVSLLKKCIAVDLHPSEFPVGKVVSTVFAKASAVVHRTEENTFELIVRRSFADYVWLWLQDASREFGLSVKS